MKKSTERFSDKVDNYVKYRPSYPNEAISWVLSKCSDRDEQVFADIGSGTGIFTKLLLDNNKTVYSVEPNKEMREAAENELRKYKKYISINGSAEQTCLNDKSITTITVAQAFHWFDRSKCEIEFKRILKEKGYVFLIWNLRKHDTEFLSKYEELLIKYSEDYRAVSTENRVDENIINSFLPIDLDIRIFPYYQALTWPGFLGRHFSASYSPKEGTQESKELLEEMNKTFISNSVNGLININYDTKVYCGKFT